jgi:hypothetical protein
MLQAGRSRVRDSTGRITFFFFNLPNPSGRTRPWGSLSLWQKWVPETRDSCSRRVKFGKCLGLTTLPPSVSRSTRECETLDISQHYRTPNGLLRGQLSCLLTLLLKRISLGILNWIFDCCWWPKTKLKSVVWVRQRTVPTVRPWLGGEVSANYCG